MFWFIVAFLGVTFSLRKVANWSLVSINLNSPIIRLFLFRLISHSFESLIILSIRNRLEFKFIRCGFRNLDEFSEARLGNFHDAASEVGWGFSTFEVHVSSGTIRPPLLAFTIAFLTRCGLISFRRNNFDPIAALSWLHPLKITLFHNILRCTIPQLKVVSNFHRCFKNAILTLLGGDPWSHYRIAWKITLTFGFWLYPSRTSGQKDEGRGISRYLPRLGRFLTSRSRYHKRIRHWPDSGLWVVFRTSISEFRKILEGLSTLSLSALKSSNLLRLN